MWEEVRPGRREGWVVATQSACTGMARLKAVGQGTRGAHGEYVAHGRDAGRIPSRYVRVEIIQAIEAVSYTHLRAHET